MNQYPPPPPSPGVPPPYPDQPPQTEGLATTALVLGILSVSCLGCFGGIPAVICGHLARGRILHSNGTRQGSGMALAGLVLGYLSIVPTILVMLTYTGTVIKNIPRLQSGATPPVVEAQTNQLATALQKYKAQYAEVPQITPKDGEVVDTATLVGILGGKNDRSVTYYQPGRNGIQINGLPTDLWAQPLRIAIDLNGDGFVQVGKQRVTGIVAVWSIGPNHKDELGNGDDVASWHQNVANPPLER